MSEKDFKGREHVPTIATNTSAPTPDAWNSMGKWKEEPAMTNTGWPYEKTLHEQIKKLQAELAIMDAQLLAKTEQIGELMEECERLRKTMVELLVCTDGFEKTFQSMDRLVRKAIDHPLNTV